MSFLGKAWKIIVGIKDGLVLVFMLLFFVMLFSILSATPNPGQVRDGALYIDMTGFVVEEKSEVDPLDTLLSGSAPPVEILARDMVRALDHAASDNRVKAVVLDLTGFIGGGQVHMQEIADAMDRVRKAEKPVLTYALGYGDDHMHLASHASEVWVDPMGGAVIAGPGGARLYYAGLLDKLKVNMRVYRVGTFKSAVEPYILSAPSEAALENQASLYGALWEEWQANVKKARPSLELDRVISDPVAWVEGSSGDLAKAALDAGLVDKIGTRVEFGEHIATVAGEDPYDKKPGAYAKSEFAPYLADIGPGTGSSSNEIAVVTIAGTIVDGEAGPGAAGGERIVKLLDEALIDDNVKGLVVRVDSPGGSAMASEDIRLAVERFRAEKDVPVAVSFANVAASGGYWVATKADRIFAQPETITGSIGVFAFIPTFENTAAEIGVNAAGYRTTPLSGQPDLIDGFTPEIDAILQASVENTYSEFLTRVAQARNMTTARVDEIAQGRVWDGGTARQLGLVDQFGGLGDALQWVAAQAGLEDDDWSTRFLGKSPSGYDSLIRQLLTNSAAPAEQTRGSDLFAMTARQREVLLSQIASDAQLLTSAQGVQAYCLECPNNVRPSAAHNSDGFAKLIASWLAR
ncbi:signal peptide peptidase SppA [Erythrobacter sp. SCSIO 43205]|uniref:signal peptide peptidase SppA n=1 Tax=Erythrobacter sp. SCSIO 43205 TaxID=2779361 RepID=UPI001CA8CD70|nr:signal peptide peptidase SppA [Erythrobacter sp. SCSIO 43205]UAB79035.1 signal peptide peptidase SppA [Erythrobacter sp. SCSIO 43205]